jgi:hypothetical protein
MKDGFKTGCALLVLMMLSASALAGKQCAPRGVQSKAEIFTLTMDLTGKSAKREVWR